MLNCFGLIWFELVKKNKHGWPVFVCVFLGQISRILRKWCIERVFSVKCYYVRVCVDAEQMCLTWPACVCLSEAHRLVALNQSASRKMMTSCTEVSIYLYINIVDLHIIFCLRVPNHFCHKIANRTKNINGKPIGVFISQSV